MYILLALVAAIALGIALHYALPHRATRGVILTPGVAALVAAAVYAALTWLGWGEGNVWLWLVTLASAIVVPAVLTLILGAVRSRRDRDAQRRLRLA